MPNATLTASTLGAPLTNLTIANAIATAMQTAGFTLTGTTNGVTETRTFSCVVNGAATKGTVYIKVDVTATQLSYVLTDNAAHANPASSGNMGLNLAQNMSLIACNHPEIRGVHVANASFAFPGYARPANKYSWWDESQFLYAFLPLANALSKLQSLPVGYIPLSAAGNSLPERLIDAPPSGGPQLIRMPYVIGTASGNRCAWGQFSSDVVAIPGSGFSAGAEFVVGSDRYTLILPSNTDLTYLGVKVA